jgi:hypothetical protein
MEPAARPVPAQFSSDSGFEYRLRHDDPRLDSGPDRIRQSTGLLSAQSLANHLAFGAGLWLGSLVP